MAKRANILARSKRVEADVAKYFWPDHAEDEQGSVRDWKELWDCSGLGFDGELIICEVKSWKWPRGPRGVMRQLENAREQLSVACAKTIMAWFDECDGKSPAWEVVVYKPTGSKVADALCYFDWHGQMVAMPAHEFRKTFIEGESDE